MSTFVIPPSPLVSLPVAGEVGRFPVRRVFCVGRNYAEHAREMGVDPARHPPVFFSKPADAVLPEGGDLPYPPATSDLHHEVELVVALKRGGLGISVAQADSCVFGYGVGIDLTRRDLQAKAKKAGEPWDMAKGFDLGAPVGVLSPADSLSEPPTRGPIRLSVNGAVRQDGDLSQMIWSVGEIIHHLSTFVELRPGDLIFTGTPSGVGACGPGDTLDAMVGGLASLSVRLLNPRL
ncbi:fumarylacetoacetate hydrolase family protein [Roseospira marina]|uniref:Fumarylacetoacetate hydrolase family protein n=1 Tax=Roseospira marina TaxID=140057 RepID=A0A5M6ID05_9PROT|nr:fumarylacetoacetate hydrolase family protein [Roseospira marina]KAA5606160.1 fumarylacetoacetate hydrolase family protein [Roseospira marina]MBB4314300.1 fumarylpyruvate hydrolase [Roseospira marina]MBB5087460.1 fumarylpyruvate hydrolase [Roseospira marina]